MGALPEQEGVYRSIEHRRAWEKRVDCARCPVQVSVLLRAAVTQDLIGSGRIQRYPARCPGPST